LAKSSIFITCSSWTLMRRLAQDVDETGLVHRPGDDLGGDGEFEEQAGELPCRFRIALLALDDEA